MPEASIHVSIEGLSGALSGVTALLGAPGGDAPGTGLAGGAAEVSVTPAARMDSFGVDLTARLSGTLTFDAGGITGAGEMFATLRTAASTPPTDALAGFGAQITAAGTAFDTGFIGRLTEAAEAVRGLVEGIPQNPTAVVSALLDQILAVLGTLNGPEAEAIRAWIQSLQEQHAQLMPLIEEAMEADDPAALVLDVFRRALEGTLEVFGYGEVRRFVADLDRLSAGLVPAPALQALGTAGAGLEGAYATLVGLVDADIVEYRQAVVDAAAALNQVNDAFRAVAGVLNRVATTPLLQPGALEAWLRARMDEALGVRVHEVQRIDDPFKALFDRIDAAIQGIDLEFVRTDVLGFFERTRDAIDGVQIPSLADLLDEQLDQVDEAVASLQGAVNELISSIQAYFEGLVAQARSLAGNVGAFAPDGSFRFHAEDELRRVLGSARNAVAGDPNDPDAPSLAGGLAELKLWLETLMARLDGVLDPMAAQVVEARDTAVEGIGQFTQFLTDIDVPAKLEELRLEVERALDALGPIDFAVVVDPVIGVIDENTEKLRGIDTSQLNDLLKAALSAALEVIISIDFGVQLSAPLEEQMANVRRIPEEAIAALQAGFDRAVESLDALQPSTLLAALFDAFDTIAGALRGLSVATLAAPLDDLWEEHLEAPLGALKPSVLLQPVSDAYGELIGGLDEIRGADIVAPVNDALGLLKDALDAADVPGAINGLKADVLAIQDAMRALRPSEILQPLVADLERLEGELDRFKPSVVFAPAAELAGPLLSFLEDVQAQTVEALFHLFQEPLSALDRLRPEALLAELRAGIDGIIGAVRALGLPAAYARAKAQYFDLHAGASAGGVQMRVDLAVMVDPETALGPMMRAHDALLAALTTVRDGLALPDLDALYEELRTRLLDMLPPYARALLDPEAFRRVMRLADPTRFLEELDARYQAVLDRLLPIRPADIAGELDETYDAVLERVEALQVDEALDRVLESFGRVRDAAAALRVDFVAADVDRGVDMVRQMARALDVARLFPELDALHADVLQVVVDARPSALLAPLDAPLAEVRALVDAVDPRVHLAPPLDAAWDAVVALLQEIDFAVVLSPLLDRLDELEASLKVELGRTEGAFDRMLGAGRAALGGGGGASLTASVEVSF